MAVTTTVLNQKAVPGVGLHTAGTFNFDPTSNYPAGGESAASISQKLGGRTTIDNMQFGMSQGVTAYYDKSVNKIRVFALTAGVVTELAGASAYPGTAAVPFTVTSR